MPEDATASKQRFSTLAIQLLSQYPAERVAWRTMSGPFTVAQIRASLEERSELGLQWLSDFLRVMRDVFAFRASAGSPAAAMLADELLAAAAVDKLGFIKLIDEAHAPDKVLYWSESTGPVSANDLQEALQKDEALAAAYVACFIHEFKTYLTQRA